LKKNIISKCHLTNLFSLLLTGTPYTKEKHLWSIKLWLYTEGINWKQNVQTKLKNLRTIKETQLIDQRSFCIMNIWVQYFKRETYINKINEFYSISIYKSRSPIIFMIMCYRQNTIEVSISISISISQLLMQYFF
jgi:hypothetical protein